MFYFFIKKDLYEYKTTLKATFRQAPPKKYIFNLRYYISEAVNFYDAISPLFFKTVLKEAANDFVEFSKIPNA